MKIVYSAHQFCYPWQKVTAANWCKYPNVHSPQVIHVDVLDRRVDPERGVLITERLIACKQPAPRWLSRMFGGDNIHYVREVSEVNPVTKQYTAVSTNLSLSNIISLREQISYSVDPKNANRTLLEQEAIIDVGAGFATVKNYLEDFCISHFDANAEKGRKGLETVIHSIFPEVRMQQQAQ